jgi:hypothetical protein
MPSRPSSSRFKRCWIALAGGLLALCLQLGAQVLPAEAMQGAMRAAALTPAEAQSFAATCLGLAVPGKGQPAKSGQHGASCPVCFTLAQAQGFAAPAIDFTTVPAWTDRRYPPAERARTAVQVVARAFNSQAPPVLAI